MIGLFLGGMLGVGKMRDDIINTSNLNYKRDSGLVNGSRVWHNYPFGWVYVDDKGKGRYVSLFKNVFGEEIAVEKEGNKKFLGPTYHDTYAYGKEYAEAKESGAQFFRCNENWRSIPLYRETKTLRRVVGFPDFDNPKVLLDAETGFPVAFVNGYTDKDIDFDLRKYQIAEEVFQKHFPKVRLWMLASEYTRPEKDDLDNKEDLFYHDYRKAKPIKKEPTDPNDMLQVMVANIYFDYTKTIRPQLLLRDDYRTPFYGISFKKENKAIDYEEFRKACEDGFDNEFKISTDYYDLFRKEFESVQPTYGYFVSYNKR